MTSCSLEAVEPCLLSWEKSMLKSPVRTFSDLGLSSKIKSSSKCEKNSAVQYSNEKTLMIGSIDLNSMVHEFRMVEFR